MEEDKKQQLAAVIVIIIIGVSSIGGYVVFFEPFEDELEIIYALFSDQNGNNFADTLNLSINNKANFKIAIDKISIRRFNQELDWISNESISIDGNSKIDVICQTSNSTEELQFFDDVSCIVYYMEKGISLNVVISIEFSNLNFLYSNNFDGNLDYQNWKHFLFRDLNGSPIHGGASDLFDWTKEKDPIELDGCLMCKTSNCQFIILNKETLIFNDFNLSVDIRRRDNDGVGIILRYNEINGYPRFYLLWQTSDHPVGEDEEYLGETHLYNWSSEIDTVNHSEITLHYVEGYDAGNSNIGFQWTKLNSTYYYFRNQWYNWRVNLNGSSLGFSFQLNQILTYNGLSMTNGSIGLVSFDSRAACFDNLYIW